MAKKQQNSGGVVFELGEDEHDEASKEPVTMSVTETETEKAVVEAKPAIRPSEASRLAKEAGYTDVHKFLKDEGYPAPKRKIRVVPANADKASRFPAIEVEAFDESDALRQFVAHYKFGKEDVHKITLHATVIEE